MRPACGVSFCAPRSGIFRCAPCGARRFLASGPPGPPNLSPPDRSRHSVTRHQWTVLALCGLAVLASSFDGSVLFLALPAVSSQFRASFSGLADLGSVLALGSLGALPFG